MDFLIKTFGFLPKKLYLCNPNSKINRKEEDSLAQLVEHHTFNVGVSGSSPERVTNFSECFLSSVGRATDS